MVAAKGKNEKSLEEKKDALRAELDEQQKIIKRAKGKKKEVKETLSKISSPKGDSRKEILFGKAIMEMMAKDPELEKQVLTRLNLMTKCKKDRKLLGLKTVNEGQE